MKSYMMLKTNELDLDQLSCLHNILSVRILLPEVDNLLTDSDLTLRNQVKKESSLLRGIEIGLTENGIP